MVDTAFEVEEFGKIVALFDSDKLGEAENAFRKAVLLCRKYGLRFCDAAGEAFGKGAGVDAAEVERMKQDVAEAARVVQGLQGENAQLQAEVARLQEALDGRNESGDGEEHVIDVPGRLRRAWGFWQFRLFVLTLSIGVAAAVQKPVAGVLCVFLFGCWSVALFRKRGFAQMLLKWLVYGAVLLAGAVAMDNLDAGARPPVFLLALAVGLVLTLTKISRWLGGLIRAHIWESGPVKRVRGWFRDR